MTETSYLKWDDSKQLALCQGDWLLANVATLNKTLAHQTWPSSGNISIDGSAITKMDSAGAWLIIKTTRQLEARGLKPELKQFPKQTQTLLDFVQKKTEGLTELPHINPPSSLAKVGKSAMKQVEESIEYLSFVGKLSLEVLSLFWHPR